MHGHASLKLQPLNKYSSNIIIIITITVHASTIVTCIPMAWQTFLLYDHDARRYQLILGCTQYGFVPAGVEHLHLI